MVIGEGEITFVELLTWLQDKGSLPLSLMEVVVPFQGQVQINESRLTIDNIDEILKQDYLLG